MKVFIYNNLIDNPVMQEGNKALAQRDRLEPHLAYLNDIYYFLKKFETTNPEEADCFFVPLFLAGMQFSNLDPEKIINEHCTHLDRGNHVLVSTGDVGQRKESIHEMTHEANPIRAYDKKWRWMDDRFILIALESLATLHKQDIAMLPYQTHEVASHVCDRDIFASFMGKMAQLHLPYEHIRGGRLVELQAAAKQMIIGWPDDIAKKLGKELHPHELMSRSVFTLCPAGYGRWSFRFIEALLCGSIPVLLSDDYVLPFADKIKWGDLCVVIQEKDLLNVESILQAIPHEKVEAMQEAIKSSKHMFCRDFILSCIAEKLPQKSCADIAIGKMRSPESMHIVCVDVTNKCDLACSNCTRLLANQETKWEMSVENFRLALQSLKNYGGIIAMIGGNPCVHTKFAELCQVFREEIPNQFQRGLWTNNYFKHREVIEQTFGALNLNPHNMERANEKLKDLHNVMINQRGFNGGYYVGNSHHAPLLTAVKDLYPEQEMWDRISRCDINKDWSASIIQNKGQLRAYFCEVAASFDLARGEDHGHPVVLDWWKKPISAFSDQVKHFCTGCGVPARLRGHMDNEETDTYTKSNADIAEKSLAKGRSIRLLDVEKKLEHKVTEYFAG